MWKKPLPSVDEGMHEFAGALREHRFLVQECVVCGRKFWPASYCPHDARGPWMANMHWTESSGSGHVFTFNIHYRAFHKGFEHDLPYVYALIELDDGPILGSNIVECDPESVFVGMPVIVRYVDVAPESGEVFDPFTLPVFVPRETPE